MADSQLLHLSPSPIDVGQRTLAFLAGSPDSSLLHVHVYTSSDGSRLEFFHEVLPHENLASQYTWESTRRKRGLVCLHSWARTASIIPEPELSAIEAE